MKIHEIERETEAIECNCGGYAARVPCTNKEIKEHQECGRSYECCLRAFVCRVCGKRIIGHAPAPEME